MVHDLQQTEIAMKYSTKRVAVPIVLTAFALVAALGPGCSLIIKYSDPPGERQACDDGNDSVPRDLRITIDNMDPHIGNLTEVHVVNPNDYVVARAILDPLPGRTFSFTMRRAILPGPHRIDLYADLSGNRGYDPPPLDHAWRLEPCTSGVHEFSHNSNFIDISEPQPRRVGGDFVLLLSQMNVHLGQLVEVHVIDSNAGRTVGFYRLAELLDPQTELIIPGIIEQGVHYVVALYADKNNSGSYDPPDVDHSWRIEQTGGPDGLVVQFAHNTSFADITEELGL
jgi:hypothetical protein